LLQDKKILLPDHVGSRIASDLKRLKFDVTVLKDREWTELSPRIKVLSLSDYNQDGILLIDINGTLILDLNDSSPRGWGGYIKKIASKYKETFLLQIAGYGDADMINYFDEDGRRIEPRAALKLPVGATVSRVADAFNIRHVLPFSSLHKYQRSDSIWANEYTTPLEDYSRGFASRQCDFLPAFIRYDCANGDVEEINPAQTPDVVVDPIDFGDDWSEPLKNEDRQKLEAYIKAISHLGEVMDFINFRVGSQDNIIELRDKGFKKGIVFEAPRRSLMRAARWEIFDDLLIGNFMKTSLVGKWPQSRLYPDFTPYVSKYADNGLAKSPEEIHEYFQQYSKRAPFEFFRHRLENSIASIVRTNLDTRSPLYQVAQKSWWFAKQKLPM